MSEPQDPRDLLDLAERAATTGDLESAHASLRRAAQLQEERLGPQHPDLANTLNNLAIVAERIGQPDEAEACYRRAVAIAAASLPPDHPMVVDSRQNLEDFCRARGVPIERPPVAATMPPAAVPSAQPAPVRSLKPIAEPPSLPPGVPASAPPAIRKAAEQPAPRSSPAPRAPAPIATEPLPPLPAGDTRSRPTMWLAAASIALLALVLLVWRPWSRDEATGAGEEATSAPVTSPAPPAATEPGEPPAATPRSTNPAVTTGAPRVAPAPAAGATVDAQLCRDFSARGSRWRCTSVGNPVTPGRLVLYTRVKSPRNTTVVHRWYRGTRLRQSVRLSIRANATEGYRTYSRQTVTPGEWRVEVTTGDGRLLDEQRFTVK